MLSIVKTAKVPFEFSHVWGRHFTHDLYSQTTIRLKITQFWAQLQISVAYFCSIGLYFLV